MSSSLRSGGVQAADDPGLEAEGRADQVEGGIRQVGEKLKDAAKNVRASFKS